MDDFSFIDSVLGYLIKNMNMILYSLLLITASVWIALKSRSVFDKWFEKNVPDKEKTEADISYIRSKLNNNNETFKTAVKEFRITVQNLQKFIAKDLKNSAAELSLVKERVATIEGASNG